MRDVQPLPTADYLPRRHTRREIGTASLLFLVTALTTSLAGGPMFGAVLLAILTTHELGHFFAGRRQRVDVSLPYFIPAPTIIGTFGAVIRMRGPIWHRRGLLRVGAAGPLAGFVVAVPVYIWGMAHSQIIDVGTLGPDTMRMGDSVLTAAIQRWVLGPLPAGHDVMLHPAAFAAWIGLFVTGLNLLPLGQFDGGHVLYAIAPDRYPWIARGALMLLVALGLTGWRGWLLWGAIALLLGATRHPPTVVVEPQLDGLSQQIAIWSLLVFALTFVPAPFAVGP